MQRASIEDYRVPGKRVWSRECSIAFINLCGFFLDLPSEASQQEHDLLCRTVMAPAPLEMDLFPNLALSPPAILASMSCLNLNSSR